MYKLDTEAARGAESTGSRITEKGKYKGKFLRAQHIESEKTGTVGIDFDFQANDGRRARFSIYTTKADGTRIYGFKQVMAIMTCLGIRELAEPKNVPAKIYDYDAQREVERVVLQFPELIGKPIGLLLAMEEYSAGKWRPNLGGVFQEHTELVASEILDRKTTPTKLPLMLQALKDKPMREGSAPAGDAPPSGHPAAYDDDIPF